MIPLFSKIPIILLLVLSALSVTTGDFFAKYWSTNGKNVFYLLAILGYIGSSIFYIPTLTKEGLVVTSVIWGVLSMVGLLIVGLFIFKENLTTLEMWGAGLGVASLIVFSFSK